MTVLLDISRLIARQHFATPTGIDRFELSYARWLLDSGLDASFVETGAPASTLVPRRAAAALVERVDRHWAASVMSAEEARQLATIVAAIEGREPWQPESPPHRSAALGSAVASRAARALRQVAHAWTSLPQRGTFIHVSHARLNRPASFAWLGSRPRAVFYVHDLIPLSHPEFVRAGEPERHMQRMRTVLRHAGLVLCNSRVTGTTLDRLAEEHGLPQPRIAVLPPGVNDVFLRAPDAGALATARPYFVCIGTIEPRKNHALLLKLWRRLVERQGESAPRLVIVGRRGWDNAELFKILDRPGPLRQAVIEVPDLSDAPLTRLLAGASALLAPSFVEGYGMPVAEGLAVGTPVIASDIASHREIAGGAATLLDPLDGRGWLQAIEAHAARHAGRRGRAPRLARPRWSWSEHFRSLERLMAADLGAFAHPAGRSRRAGGIAAWTAPGAAGPFSTSACGGRGR